MIYNYKQFINEKLSDKLSGFDSIGLLHQYEKGEINLQRYLMICYKNDIKIPGDFEKILKEKFLNGTIKLKTYINTTIKYHLKQPTREEIHDYLNKYYYDNIDLYFLYACEFNFQDIIDSINLDDVSNLYYKTALPFVIKYGNFELFKILINRNDDLNNEFDNPLYIAVKYKQNDMIKYLLKIGVIVYDDVFELDMSPEIKILLKKCYDTPVKKRNEILIEKLSDKLSGFNEKELKQQFLSGNIDLLKYLYICNKNNLELPTNQEIYDSVKNYTNYDKMLVVACKYNFFDLVKKSIKNGSEYHKYDFEPITNACKTGNIELVKFLLENGAYDYIDDALYEAVKCTNYELVKYLLEINAHISQYLITFCDDKKIKNILQQYYDKQNDNRL